MDRHAITQQHAFEALAHASQQINRKLRDLAVDVIETGWLDPELIGPLFDIGSPEFRKDHGDAHGIDGTRRRPPRR